MKKSDFIFLLVATAIFLPFFISDDAYEWYKTFNTSICLVGNNLRSITKMLFNDQQAILCTTRFLSLGPAKT